jgi:hypothetical protein
MTDEALQGPGRRTVLRKGLLAGLGTAMVGIAAPVLAGTGTARAYVSGQGVQYSWAWCYKCEGLFYSPFGSRSWCPAGGRHGVTRSYNYYLNYANNPYEGSQNGWAWCDKCMGLFYGPNQGSSWCPAGGRHDGSRSYNYLVGIETPFNPPVDGVQSYWRWCDKCMGLFYGPNQGSSWCPAGGRHNGSESDIYTISYDTNSIILGPQSRNSIEQAMRR